MREPGPLSVSCECCNLSVHKDGSLRRCKPTGGHSFSGQCIAIKATFLSLPRDTTLAFRDTNTMAPLNTETEAAPGDAPSSTPIGSRPWVILAIVFGAVCVVGCGAALVHRWYKKSRPYREVAGDHDTQPVMATRTTTPSPTATWPKLSPSLSVRSIHSVVDERQLEMQRAQIIRKSLASRASSRDMSMSQPSRETLRPARDGRESPELHHPHHHHHQQQQRQQAQHGKQQSQERDSRDCEQGIDTEDDTPVESPVGMVRDWKRWEAGVQQDSSRSLAYHPSMEELPANDAGAAAVRSRGTSPPAQRPLTYPAITDVSLASPFGGRQHPKYSPLSPVGEADNEYTHL